MFLKFLNIYSSLRLRYSQKENCFIRMRETPIRHIGRGQLSNHYRGEKSLRHVAMVANFLDLNKPWSNKYRRKKNEQKHDIYPFPPHHCTEEQNGSPYFSSIIRECKWPSLSRTRNFANMVT